MASDEKVTVMILEVDLKCSCCYKKVKKLLCKFPQIRDQVFDEDKNKVKITVVCCNPEKLRDKLCCKGGGTIQSIEIVEPKKPKEDPKPNPPPPSGKPSGKPDPKPPSLPPVVVPIPPPKEDPKPNPPPKQPDPYPSCPPVSTCCQECYQGLRGGPCHYGYGRPVPPPPGPCYDGYPYGGSRPCYVRCDYYFSEENPRGCSIM